MNREKAKKAEEELVWRKSLGFARLFEQWLRGDADQLDYYDGKKKVDLFSLLTNNEKEWLLKSYGKTSRNERRIFFKAISYFIYLLGTQKIGCENLVQILKKMAAGGAKLGEFYDYLVQYSDEKIKYRGTRLNSIVSVMRKESGVEKEYYKWFSREFHVPPEGIWSEYPDFFTTKTPREFIEMRRKVKWDALSSILSSIYGIYVGSAILGKIKKYVQNGGITKLSFENRERAARVANLLFEFGLQDISQNSNKITLGLKETIYEARKKIELVPKAGLQEYMVKDYLAYFKSHGLDTANEDEISRLFNSGNEVEAVEKMCKSMLQVCKKHYLIMGEKKYAFGDEGLKMITDFKKHVGAKGDASLLLLYDMIRIENYPSALGRLTAICDAIEEVREDYPHMFSP